MGDALTWVEWVRLVEIPVILGLAAAILKTRSDLAAYKTEVAKDYASVKYIKDVEDRLSSHLVRIEDKLDKLRGGD